MAKYQTTVHCIDFNSNDEVRYFLNFLKNNRARVTAFDQKKPNFNTFAVLTKYREKEIKK